jgi:Ankyrin repeats (3 copies)
MANSQLPDRPNLEQLKKQAKTLLRDAQAGEAAARARFAELPAFASAGTIDPAKLALHDAQSVVAREYGFPSWNALRDEVEARTLTFEAAVDEFVRCATGDARGRAERLLALFPRIAQASFHTALVRGDVDAVEAVLRDHPERAREPGGVHQDWEPLQYVCHTCLSSALPGTIAIARRLCALGANPNAEYHWNWHPELPRTVLWAAVCAVGSLPLAEVLLEAGANPTDGVTSHISSGGGNTAALDLLAKYGLNANGIPGGVPPLVYMMTWARPPEGVRWLLEHGADPNLSWGRDDEAPIHVAARRWDVPIVEALAAHGADLTRRRGDGRTPFAVAALSGNDAVARWLAEHGAGEELSPLDRFVAACARGDREAASAMLRDRPTLRDELKHEHHLLLHRAAESGDVTVLETMLSCGFDTNVRDPENVTPLHRASMSGHPEAVRLLLAHGADVTAQDSMFSASPLVWAVEGRRHPKPDSDHVAVARLLLAAGVSREWTPPEGAPSPEGTLDALIDLQRAAAA